MEATETGLPEITLMRLMNAPRELLWEVWTNAHHVAQWWGPQGFTNPECEWDAQPGNKIYVNMVSPDGHGLPMKGEFKELVKPERLVFTSAILAVNGSPIIEVLNTITFTGTNGKTRATVHAKVLMATETAQPFLEGMHQGWNASIDKLEDYIQDKLNEFKFHI